MCRTPLFHAEKLPLLTQLSFDHRLKGRLSKELSFEGQSSMLSTIIKIYPVSSHGKNNARLLS